MSILEKHQKLIDRIFKEEYYPKLLSICMDAAPGIKESTDLHEIHKFWNDFWFLLPDHPSIRTGPFFEVCDMSEGEYLLDE